MKILKSIYYLFFPPKIVKAVYKGGELEGIMTVTYNDDSEIKYKGGVTVWHELPLMKRCSTDLEYYLSDIQEYIEHYGNPYPTAHKTNQQPS